MSDNSALPKARPAFMDRPVKLKFVLVIVVVLILAAVVALAVQAVDHSREMSRVRKQALERAETTASVLAHAIAVFGNEMIVNKEYNQLQDYADNLISAKECGDISYIAVVDNEGTAVVHTDRGFTGRPFSGAQGGEDAAQGAAKVMDLTRQVGTVYVGIRIEPK